MKIVSTATLKGDFVLQDDNDKTLLELNYTNWFSSKAQAMLKGNTIVIHPKNIWQTKFDILINDSDRGDITFNWKGHIIILIDEVSYLLKTTSIWKLGFELINEKEEQVLKVKPNLSWKEMKYDYEIQEVNTKLTSDDLSLLLLCVGFGTNLYMTNNMYS